jgi:hypothetical protein
LRVSAYLPIRGKGGLGGIPRSAPFDASASTPRGASGLVGDPTPDEPRIYSNTLFTHPLNQDIRASVGSPTRTGSRPRGARGEGGTTGAADLLSAGHSPHPLAWSQALPPSHARPQAGQAVGAPKVRLVYRPEAVHLAQGRGMINNSERTRRLLTTNPIPLESPGALGYSPLFSFPFAFLSTLRVVSFKRVSDCR